ncbi:class I SAM-dependent methyltransferase [Scytonema sp. PCC 10023]|uniref:class I SAM-dependent methyltransferase n=1 Tax=Scytonema sp. PCC 10023 TaxID=1680591 RepID=UPI0039C6524F
MSELITIKDIAEKPKAIATKLLTIAKNCLKFTYRYLVPTESAVYKQSIEADIGEHKHLLKGRVLNAGAGWRDLSHLVDGELVNQDLYYPGDTRNNIQIYSPLHKIPVEDNLFDVIICIGVIEHVENPEEVLPEFYRVLKHGGHLILDIPFLQPEHKCPTDFQRYTKDGITRLVEHNGFSVLSVKGRFTVYHTLYWVVWIWLHHKSNLIYMVMRMILLRPLLLASKYSKTYSDRLASCFQILAVKS